ncbi:MAG: hypothetical protein U0835_07915 [Isosphaeraceae bacterium]
MRADRGSGGSRPGPIVEDASGWPGWARGLVTFALAVHLTAVLSGALAAPPSSLLERGTAELFRWYHDLVDQGYAYRYYAPEPGPTPVVTARVQFADGRAEEVIRLPERGLFPRLRYQRQLALANHLTDDWREARRATGDGANSVFARSFARHVARIRPGASTVTLYTQTHLIPDPAEIREALEHGNRVDLDAEEFFTAPERIGEFPCDGL